MEMKTQKNLWREVFYCEIPIKVAPKQRARFSGRSGTVYTPSETKRFEAYVRGFVMLKYRKHPLEGPVRVDFTFTFGHKSREGFHTQRPDFDNTSKAVADALNQVLYKDDKQIAQTTIMKVWGKDSKIELWLYALNEEKPDSDEIKTG